MDVELVHHRRELTTEKIRQCFGEDVSRASLRYMEPDANWLGSRTTWLSSSALRRRWKAEISEGGDILISICSDVPPYCQARMGILYVLFPFVAPPQDWPWAKHKGD